MSLRRRLVELLLALLTVLVMMLAGSSSRGQAATFTLPSLASYTGTTQATDAYQPAISGDGGYVTFTGLVDGVQGVWEKDLSTGALSLVAGDQSGGLAAFNAPDAGSPSVSSNGQYVAFTTTADLDPADDPQPDASCSSVYVRDMDVPIGQSGAYTLVSALNGSSTGLAYALDSAGTACAAGGAASADRVAISADGNEVAFTVIGQSDLTTGTVADPTTPPDQVAVRYISQQQTMLVSQTMASEQDGGTPEPVPDGAAMTTSDDATTTTAELADGQDVQEPTSASTAAISADGSTVAWLGIDIPAQAPTDSAVASVGGPGDGAPASYPDWFDEPLWREIALGPSAPTRRVTGGDDPGSPTGQGPLDEYLITNGYGNDVDAVGPEFGTYVASDYGFGGYDGDPSEPSLDAATPALSANGQEVAFLSTAWPYGQVPVASPGQGGPNGAPANVYVVNMATGLTRDEALTQLTDDTQANEIAISPDGTKVAFTTYDITFPLSWPTLVTPQLSAAPGIYVAELYEVDLTAGTISLVSYGYDGNPANGTVQAPSFTTDGDTLAFASAATNLVYSAENDGTNVFTLTENTSPDVPGTVAISPQPTVAVVPKWVLSVTGAVTKTGAARIAVSVPGAGELTASATALVTAARKTKDKTLTQANKRSKAAGVLTFTLTPGKAYRSRIRARGGLLATIRVRFTAAGKRTLTQSLQLTLHARASKAKATKKKNKPKKPNRKPTKTKQRKAVRR